jgi:prepilin-type N-terminal cleavage/methylation domain-containing protein
MMRAGVTLVELLVTVAILGMMFGVSGLALLGLRTPQTSGRVRAFEEARAEAIRSGHPVRVTFESLSVRLSDRRFLATPTVLFLPDSRAIGTGVDPLTGAPLHEQK